MAKKISIKTIAQETGVSTATVSLVLSGKGKEGRIGKVVSEKILKVARELNYRPNTIAQSLRTGRTKTLGLIVADISNPFFAKLARHIENLAAEKGYQVMFGSSDESSVKLCKLINLFLEKNVEGIIAVPPEDSENAIMQLVKYGIPSVLVDRAIEGIPVSSVQIDNVGAAYSLTNHLIMQGCRKIGFLAYNIRLPNIEKRYEGYQKALIKNGIDLDERLVHSVAFENFEKNIADGLDKLLENKVDSIVFATNRVGVQSMLTLKDSKYRKKLKFVSIDNPDEYRLSDIPIKCIGQPIEEMGRRALDILFRKIENPKYTVTEQVVLTVNEII